MVGGVGVIPDGAIDVDDADDFFGAFAGEFAGFDGDAEGAADAEVVDAFAGGESAVGHGVAGEDAFAAGEDVIDDGAGGVDFFWDRLLIGFDGDARLVIVGLGFFVFVFAGADDFGCEVAFFFVVEKDDAVIGFDVLEDEVHDDFKNLIDAEAAAQGCAELVEDF